MNIKKVLKKLNKDLKQCLKIRRATILFTIIQLKSENIEHINYKNPLYLEIKKFIKFYIISNDKKDFGYDKIELKKIKRAIEAVSNEKERFELCNYALRLLDINGLELEFEEFNQYKDERKTLLIKSRDFSIRKYIDLITHLSSYNLNIILLILGAIFSISYIIFLPAQHEFFEIFKVNYRSYSDNFYLNHFLNLFSLLFGLETEKVIEPLNWLGIVILAILRTAYILLIFNYLYQKVLNIIYAK